MGQHLSCFLAYDIRGRMPDELNEALVERIARAYAAFLQPRKVAVGYDIRLSSPAMAAAVRRGLTAAGVDVVDIGRCGTEQVYYATFSRELDGGIMVTASHNPKDYNGLKLVREQSRPISADTGLKDIEALIVNDQLPADAAAPGKVEPLDLSAEYARFLLAQVDVASFKPLRIVTNAGHGGAGEVIDTLQSALPFEFVKLQNEPDGNFPCGVPNPLLPENRAITAAAVREHKADMGIAWDGDFDRCFFFDEQGNFLEGYYLVGLIAELLLQRHPGQAIVYDPRLTWNTQELVAAAGGRSVASKSGHAFIKDVMRQHDALYGGEMSAHHYFREFAYCDNGHLPWLLVAELLCKLGKPLSTLVAERMARYPVSGEINRKVADAAVTMQRVEAHFSAQAESIERLDGLSMAFADWRFNLRASNTEPLLRLNVETRADQPLLEQRTRELLALIEDAQ